MRGVRVNIHWFGAPKNTPGEIVEKIDREVNAALVDPKMKHGRRFTTVFHRKRKSVHHHSMSLSCQERTIRFASAVPWLERRQREELPILWLGPQRPEATKTP